LPPSTGGDLWGSLSASARRGGHDHTAVNLDIDSPPQTADALLMRFTKNR
jgi:hypothetical protein